MSWPASTVDAFAVLVMWTTGSSTATEEVAESLPALVDETPAVLVTVWPRVAAVVCEVTWAWVDWPAPRVVGPKVRLVPFEVQPVRRVPTLQLRPGLEGRVSVACTPVSVPWPLLETVTV